MRKFLLEGLLRRPVTELPPVLDDAELKQLGERIDVAARRRLGRSLAIREVDGVAIPFASPRLLWRMKASTHRDKDAVDLVFLREWFAARGEIPPTC